MEYTCGTELEMKYICSTGSMVENEVKKYSYEEVFGHPQPGFDKKGNLDRENKARQEEVIEYFSNFEMGKDDYASPLYQHYFSDKKPGSRGEFDWRTLYPGFRPVWRDEELHIVTTGSLGMACVNPSVELHVTGKIGMEAADHDPNENLHLSEEKIGMAWQKLDPSDENGLIKPTDLFKHYKINKVDKEFFTEELKALHYDLERAKDHSAHAKLIEDFKRLWNPKAEFFDKKWDLTEKLSNKSTDYSDYAEFLEEYFDDDDDSSIKMSRAFPTDEEMPRVLAELEGKKNDASKHWPIMDYDDSFIIPVPWHTACGLDWDEYYDPCIVIGSDYVVIDSDYDDGGL